MKVFGPEPWGAWSKRELVETPDGQPCQLCDEPIIAGDLGVILPFSTVKDGKPVEEERPWHRECLLHSILCKPEDKRETMRESAKATTDRVDRSSW
jgi:hypothetical protein